MFKKTHRIPELRVQDADEDRPEVYSLSGKRHLLGGSSKSCDIVVRNPIISPIHLSLTREGKHFILKDENSTNGVYQGKNRITTAILRHGDIFTLGPPELSQSVLLQYYAPTWYVKFATYIKEYFLEITEYTLLLASFVGLVTAVFFQKLIFGAAPLSLYNLAEANLSDANLNESDLSDADLTEANMIKVDLARSILTKANLTKAILIKANLRWVNLTGANLKEVYLIKADLEGANLTGANLKLTYLEEGLTYLEEGGLTGAFGIEDTDFS